MGGEIIQLQNGNVSLYCVHCIALLGFGMWPKKKPHMFSCQIEVTASAALEKRVSLFFFSKKKGFGYHSTYPSTHTHIYIPNVK